MTKWNNSKKLFLFQILLLFIVMLLANTYTYYIGDDFGYMFSCLTHDEMHSLKDYVESIVYHTRNINGRYIAHFIGQFMVAIPKSIFNVINSVVYVAQILLCYLICAGSGKKVNNLLLSGVIMTTWVYEPLMGQTNLWVIGSCNYLWGCVAVLAFIKPYIDWYRDGLLIENTGLRIAYIFLAFVAGAYTEATSATAIFVTACVIIACYIQDKRTPKLYQCIALISAVAGYLTMIFAPSEMAAKATGITFYLLSNNLVTCVEVYKGFIPLLVTYIVLYVYSINKNVSIRMLLLSAILLTASLFANFIFIFAAYYPGRGACATAIYLIMAVGVLVSALYECGERCVSVIVPLIITPLFCYHLVTGLNDIHYTGHQAHQVVSYIEKCKQNGITTVQYPYIEGETPYSAYYGNIQLNEADSDGYPNNRMAKYFGVDHIIPVDSIWDIDGVY